AQNFVPHFVCHLVPQLIPVGSLAAILTAEAWGGEAATKGAPDSRSGGFGVRRRPRRTIRSRALRGGDRRAQKSCSNCVIFNVCTAKDAEKKEKSSTEESQRFGK